MLKNTINGIKLDLIDLKTILRGFKDRVCLYMISEEALINAKITQAIDKSEHLVEVLKEHLVITPKEGE